MSIIFFGDVGEYLAIKARTLSSDAVLIDHQNYLEILKNKKLPPVSYTALGDLPKNLSEVYSLLDLASEIIYSPPTEWSDRKTVDFLDPCNSINGLSQSIMFDFHKIKQNVRDFVISLQPNQIVLHLADHRKSNKTQLWIAGCSLSYGVGVDQAQRYGQLISDTLRLPVSFLTAAGSSVEWAADQILRSDIRSGDIVIWGLTTESRTPWFNTICDQVVHVTANNIDKFPKKLKKNLTDILASETRFYKSIISVHQVINYCKKIKSKLLILGLISSESVNFNLAHIPEFVPVRHFKNQNQFLDLGTDGMHPGPKQHQYYHTFCLKQLAKRNLI